MTQEQINQAFEGRWRIKSQNIDKALETMLIEHRIDYVKKLCRDFFTAGILLSDKAAVPEVSTSGLEEPTVVISSLFDTWWDLYDKKVGRENCAKKWRKLTTKEKEACIAATPTYVASTPDKQFRKNPLSYLNQKAWNDEIIPRNNGTDKSSLDEQRKDKLASILTE